MDYVPTTEPQLHQMIHFKVTEFKSNDCGVLTYSPKQNRSERSMVCNILCNNQTVIVKGG